jgi:hypothetical protein
VATENQRRLKALQDENRLKEPPRQEYEPTAYVTEGWSQAKTRLASGNVVGVISSYRELFRKLDGGLSHEKGDRDLFLTCYSAVQAAAKLEETNEYTGARTLCQLVILHLEAFGERYPGWNPTIVEYRLKQTREQLARVDHHLEEH